MRDLLNHRVGVDHPLVGLVLLLSLCHLQMILSICFGDFGRDLHTYKDYIVRTKCQCYNFLDIFTKKME
jgi:hypothetical protein